MMAKNSHLEIFQGFSEFAECLTFQFLASDIEKVPPLANSRRSKLQSGNRLRSW